MPIEPSSPPADVTANVRAAIAERSRRRRFVTPTLSRSRTQDLALAAPHAVHVLTLDDLVAGRGLGDAAQVSWRYLIQDGERTVAAAEVPVDADGSDGLQINEGPFVGGTESVIVELERTPEVADAAYELRMITVPALYVVALWLHDDTADFVVPIGPTHPAIETGARYTATDFVDRLRDPAREQQAFDSRPQEG